MQESPLRRDQHEVPVHMLGIQVTRQEDGKTAIKSRTRVQSYQEPGWRQVNRQDFHRFTGQHDLDGSSLLVFRPFTGTE